MIQHGTYLPRKTQSPENNNFNHASRMGYDWLIPEAWPGILSLKSYSREKEVLNSYFLFARASTI
jgi:hypothetical protein